MGGIMGVYTENNTNWFTRRGAFLALLIAFHIAIFWALKSGFAVKVMEKITEPIKAEIINEVIEEPPPPPPPEVQMELPPVQVPPILVDIQLPPPPPTAIEAPVTTEPLPPATPPAPPSVTRSVVVTRAALISRPDMADYYPSASKSLGEEGRVRIRLCIGSNGRVTEASVAEASEYPRLDEAGVRFAKAFRFRAGTTDGKTNQADCFVQPITFSLKDVQ
jgi:protein TonB